jgi:hypothetical protein
MPTTEHPLLRRLACTVLLSAALWLAAAAPAAATVQRAVADTILISGSDEQHLKAAHELGAELHATTLRIDLFWDLAEPSQGVYDDAGYLQRLEHLVHAARAENVQIVITVSRVPRWASDQSYWAKPPSPAFSGYQAFYPMTSAALDDFERFAQHLSTLLQGDVLAYECWNEPNLWTWFYPQQVGGDGLFAASTYFKYLKRLSAGIKAGDPGALVIAGATAPGGGNDIWRTSPQRFAQKLKTLGAADYFDAYSHHPYAIGGTKSFSPASLPLDPGDTVNLANISTLLKIFPKTAFYLTEYGYNSRQASSFGVVVGEVAQASYLKQAYAMAGRHPQIRMLFWYLLRDWSPEGDQYSDGGVYTGLRRLEGGAKPAWYAFARGNTITLHTPSSAARGASVRLQGVYSCAAVGGVAGRPLLLQRRWGSGSWVTLRTVTTGDNGYYKAFVTLKRSTRYRFVFRGVVASGARLVRMR